MAEDKKKPTVAPWRASNPIPTELIPGANIQYGDSLAGIEPGTVGPGVSLPADSKLFNSPSGKPKPNYSTPNGVIDPVTGTKIDLALLNSAIEEAVTTQAQAEETNPFIRRETAVQMAVGQELEAGRAIGDIYGEQEFLKAVEQGRYDYRTGQIFGDQLNAAVGRQPFNPYAAETYIKPATEGRFNWATGEIIPTSLTEYEIALSKAPENTIPVYNATTKEYTYRPLTEEEKNSDLLSQILVGKARYTYSPTQRGGGYNLPDVDTKEAFDAIKRTVAGSMYPDTFEEYQSQKANRAASVDTPNPVSLSRQGTSSMYHGIEAVDNSTALASRYPGLAARLMENGMSMNDVSSTYNIARAQAMSDLTLQALLVGANDRANELMATQPDNIAILTSAFLDDRIKKMQKASEEADNNGDNFIVSAGKVFWNAPLGPGFWLDLALKGSELAQHRARAFIMTPDLLLSNIPTSDKLSILFGGPSNVAWNVTNPGNLNVTKIEALKADPRFGEKATSIAVEAYLAQNYGEDDALDELYSKYKNDPEAMRIIVSGLIGNSPAGTNYSELYANVAAADQGNLGNLVAAGAGLLPNSAGFVATRDVSNITAMIAFDPTLLGGKGLQVYRFAKYGIHNMANTTSLAKAFSQRKVQNWFNWYGGEVRRIKDLRAAGKMDEAAQAEFTLKSQAKRYANDDTYEIFYKYNLNNAEEAHHFLASMETVERVMTGRSGVLLRPKAGRKQAGRLGGKTKTTYEERTVVRPEVAKLQSSFIQAQTGRRYGQVYTPNMYAATSKAKVLIRDARIASNVSARVLSRSTPAIDSVLGDDFATLSYEQQLERMTLVYQDQKAIKVLGDELGRFTGRRTQVGRILDYIVRDTDKRKLLGLDRKGWQKKGVITQGVQSLREGRGLGAGVAEGLARRVDGWQRMMTRLPDSRKPISFATADDADRIYQLARHGGLHKGAAMTMRSAWVHMNEGQRRAAYIGIVRTYARSAGIHLVDPQNGMKNVLETITGIRSTELHAANQIENYGALTADIEKQANRIVQRLAARRGVDRIPAKELEAIKQDLLVRKIATGEVVTFNPSHNGELSSAVWLGQTADHGFFPNIQALDAIVARTSMLNALLFNNRLGASVTDWWVLGTLAGPRFQLRNAIEELGLYAATGGSFRSFMAGRKISTGIRETNERFSTQIVAARSEVEKATKRLEDVKANNPTELDIARATEDLDIAQAELARVEAKFGGRGKKLGSVKSANRALATAAEKMMAKQFEEQADALAAFWLPYFSKEEVRQASEYGRILESKTATAAEKIEAREKLVEFQMRGVSRQFFSVHRDPELRAIPLRLSRGENLSPRQQQVLDDVDDLLRTPHGLEYQDAAAETARHFADGLMPAVNDMGDVALVDQQLYRTVTLRAGYDNSSVSGRVTPKQAEAMFVGLTMAVTDGPMGQSALRNLEAFWKAYNKSGGPDVAEMSYAVNRVINDIEASGMMDVYLTRFTTGSVEGAEVMVTNAMKTLVGMFTTTKGKFNQELYDALKQPLANGNVRFSLADKVDGEIIPRITADDILSGKIPASAETLVFNTEKYLVPADMKFRDRVWSQMGRSYARMVREPVWQANYLDARAVYRPFEREWAKVFGEKKAREMAADASAERAYNLTMAYADNPAVRTNFAWQVRNVARFYRAIEDFGRRMGRVAQNNPMAFWKISLVWNAAQDSGWVFNDETTGEPYFIYPGSKAALNVMNDFFNLIGTGMYVQDLQMDVRGKAAWITPSADPESWLPTLVSPWASGLYRPLLRSLPGMNGLTKEIEKVVFGSIAADQSIDTSAVGLPVVGEMVSALPSTLPPIVNKLIFGVGAALWKNDLPGSFSSKMAMKAVLAMAATGDTPPTNASNYEMSEYLERVDKTAMGLSLMSLGFGLFLPSAPQMTVDDSSDFAKNIGLMNVSPAYRALIKSEQESGGNYETAMAKFVAANPKAAIFTLGQSQTGPYGNVNATTDNLNFLMENEDLWKKNPSGMTFFVPNTGEDSIAAYRSLSLLGFNLPKNSDDYARQMVTQQGYVEYLVQRSFYYDDVNNPNRSAEEKKADEKAWQATSHMLRNTYPGLDVRTVGADRQDTSEFANQVVDARAVAGELASRGDERASDYMNLMSSYDQVIYDLRNLDPLDPNYSKLRSFYKKSWDASIWQHSQMRPDDRQWQNLMYVTYKAADSNWDFPRSDPLEDE